MGCIQYYEDWCKKAQEIDYGIQNFPSSAALKQEYTIYPLGYILFIGEDNMKISSFQAIVGYIVLHVATMFVSIQLCEVYFSNPLIYRVVALSSSLLLCLVLVIYSSEWLYRGATMLCIKRFKTQFSHNLRGLPLTWPPLFFSILKEKLLL